MRRGIWLIATLLAAAPGWTVLISGVTARLRGVSAVNERVAWATGAEGTVLRTGDGGLTWTKLAIPGAKELDFRDVDAVDERTAYALSIGPGEASRIYKTADAGRTWECQFTNRDPKAFYDAMAFWSPMRGVVFSDSVDGKFVLLVTEDGGRHWERVGSERLPAALPGEGAFAASGTNVAVYGLKHVWIGTGAGRVLRSSDGGRTWAVTNTGLETSESAGIFSIAFRDERHGIVVGGDYKREDAMGRNAAVTDDGGRNWKVVEGLGGFRSAVAWLAKSDAVVAVGPSGTDISRDWGKSWIAVPGPGFHAFSAARGGRVGWGVGESGRVGRLTW